LATSLEKSTEPNDLQIEQISSFYMSETNFEAEIYSYQIEIGLRFIMCGG